jgi:hypothetical protein
MMALDQFAGAGGAGGTEGPPRLLRIASRQLSDPGEGARAAVAYRAESDVVSRFSGEWASATAGWARPICTSASHDHRASVGCGSSR